MIHDISSILSGRAISAADGSLESLDAVGQVSDISVATLELLSHRIARSSGLEQLVYREVELDEAWRLLDAGVAEARRAGMALAAIERLEHLRDCVAAAHDMLGDVSAAPLAAERLRLALG